MSLAPDVQTLRAALVCIIECWTRGHPAHVPTLRDALIWSSINECWTRSHSAHAKYVPAGLDHGRLEDESFETFQSGGVGGIKDVSDLDLVIDAHGKPAFKLLSWGFEVFFGRDWARALRLRSRMSESLHDW